MMPWPAVPARAEAWGNVRAKFKLPGHCDTDIMDAAVKNASIQLIWQTALDCPPLATGEFDDFVPFTLYSPPAPLSAGAFKIAIETLENGADV